MKLKIIVLVLVVVFVAPLCNSSSVYGFTDDEIRAIVSKVKPSNVYGTILKETNMYRSNSINSGVVDLLNRFQLVEVIEDRSQKWYYVKNVKTENFGWVQSKYLFINDEPETNNDKMTPYEIEAYVELIDFPSYTDYFVWTDIARQQTHVFKRQGDKWQLQRTLICATGKNVTPSKRGFFILTGAKGQWFYSERLGSGAMYWVQYDGTYLFHSVAMDNKQDVIDPILGERRSSGCIRLSIEDAEWFYETIPERTSVFIN